MVYTALTLALVNFMLIYADLIVYRLYMITPKDTLNRIRLEVLSKTLIMSFVLCSGVNITISMFIGSILGVIANALNIWIGVKIINTRDYDNPWGHGVKKRLKSLRTRMATRSRTRIAGASA